MELWALRSATVEEFPNFYSIHKYHIVFSIFPSPDLVKTHTLYNFCAKYFIFQQIVHFIYTINLILLYCLCFITFLCVSVGISIRNGRMLIFHPFSSILANFFYPSEKLTAQCIAENKSVQNAQHIQTKISIFIYV